MTDSDITRRRALAVCGAAVGTGLGLGITSCSSDSDDDSDPGSDAGSDSGSDTAASPAASGEAAGNDVCVLNSSVTEGPYHLDGQLFRKNITEGKKGVPLTVRLTVRDQTESCDPIEGAAVEIWHCDAWGYYSGYTTTGPGGTSVPDESEDTSGANDKTFLRGFQLTDSDGVAEFTTIYPGWYTPRATHIHVKVHTGGRRAGNTYEGGKVNWTGQLFFADKYGDAVYRREPYSQHVGTRTKLDDDMVYGGGGAKDGLMAVKGSAGDGFTGALTVGIDPDKENTGAGTGGDGSRPPGEPPSGLPSELPSGLPTGQPST
ncbi:intradiol ring-cleavage dioxygenase [Streptomyces adelaidensis]|uniref:intradiol ring-cleavage dioxygenase n=1 Tax=Streptomyces adelaidensis TaxID=2796465 RepID=UPI001908024C|nr:intradiol ring-cleavage dioxygenase [Streptomyces adelaidensis]